MVWGSGIKMSCCIFMHSAQEEKERRVLLLWMMIAVKK